MTQLLRYRKHLLRFYDDTSNLFEKNPSYRVKEGGDAGMIYFGYRKGGGGLHTIHPAKCHQPLPTHIGQHAVPMLSSFFML